MSNPYRKSVRHLDEIDIYQIGNLYEVKSHAVFHALKKLLCAGKRGAKDYEQDLMEAIESIERELQIICEDEDNVERGPHDHSFGTSGLDGRMRRKFKRELAGVQDCGFTPTVHTGIPLDPEPDWDRRHPDLRFAVRGENGQFVYCKDEPCSGEFWVRPVEAEFDEQRIDVIGQNGNEGEHYKNQEWKSHDPKSDTWPKELGADQYVEIECIGGRRSVSLCRDAAWHTAISYRLA